MKLAGHKSPRTKPHADPEPTPVAPVRVSEPDRRNGTHEQWIRYAVQQGHDPEQAAACPVEDLIAIHASPPRRR